MGLLARASKEARESPDHPPTKGPAKKLAGPGDTMGLPILDRALVSKLRSELPEKYDFLGILIENIEGRDRGGDRGKALMARLRLALGPSCILYGKEAGIAAFATFKGDWDPEIYEGQLRLSLSQELGRDFAEALALKISRFTPDSPQIEEELVKFVGI